MRSLVGCSRRPTFQVQRHDAPTSLRQPTVLSSCFCHHHLAYHLISSRTTTPRTIPSRCVLAPAVRVEPPNCAQSFYFWSINTSHHADRTLPCSTLHTPAGKQLSDRRVTGATPLFSSSNTLQTAAAMSPCKLIWVMVAFVIAVGCVPSTHAAWGIETSPCAGTPFPQVNFSTNVVQYCITTPGYLDCFLPCVASPSQAEVICNPAAPGNLWTVRAKCPGTRGGGGGTKRSADLPIGFITWHKGFHLVLRQTQQTTADDLKTQSAHKLPSRPALWAHTVNLHACHPCIKCLRSVTDVTDALPYPPPPPLSLPSYISLHTQQHNRGGTTRRRLCVCCSDKQEFRRQGGYRDGYQHWHCHMWSIWWRYYLLLRHARQKW